MLLECRQESGQVSGFVVAKAKVWHRRPRNQGVGVLQPAIHPDRSQPVSHSRQRWTQVTLVLLVIHDVARLAGILAVEELLSPGGRIGVQSTRSEEHTSELQSL